MTNDVEDEEVIGPMKRRPRVLFGCTFKIGTSPSLYVTVNEDPSGKVLREVIVHVAKSGSQVNAYAEAIGRLISTALQANIPLETIIGQMSGIQSSITAWDNGKLVRSIPDVISQLLDEFRAKYLGYSTFIEEDDIEDKDEEPSSNTSQNKFSGELCSSCGEPLVAESGCFVCKSCGYSACSS
jgi:ribonucleoside-diphosphate reductase alpha chain